MKIYWLFLIASLGMCLWCGNRYQLINVKQHYETRAFWIQAIAFFALIIFFCGLRSGIADTGTYIGMFEGYPDNVSQIVWEDVTKDKGFYLLSVLYKQFISTDFHGWLFLIALVSGVATMIAFKKFSADFGLSCYLFVATTMFVYLVNGIRQYICVSIMFACTNWIIERKFWRFLIVVLLLSTIHASVLIFIPVYFLVQIKPWSWQMFLGLIIIMIIGLSFDSVFSFLGGFIEETQYAGYVSYISEQGVGSNVLRLLIAFIPCAIAFIAKNIVEEEGDKAIDVFINMSVINLGLYFIATFSSGMVVGRMTTYFDIYNLLLLPWLLNYVFNWKSSALMKICCMASYGFFFYYQMIVTWNMVYESDLLGIFC